MFVIGFVQRCQITLTQSAFVGSVNDFDPVILTVQSHGSNNLSYSIPDTGVVSNFFEITNSGEIRVKSDLKSGRVLSYTFDVAVATPQCSVTVSVTIRVNRNTLPPVINIQGEIGKIWLLFCI